MFLPQVDSENYVAQGAASRISDPKVLAAKLGLQMRAGDKYRVSTTSAGENVLLVERVGMLPVPAMSLDARGKKFQWSFFKFKMDDGQTKNSNVYIRHEVGSNPMPWVSADGNESNLFMYRSPYSEKDMLEPMLVSWLNHIVVPGGGVMYRIGNTILDAQGNHPIMAFKPIGRNVWEMTGFYADEQLVPGTVFWAEGNGTLFSFSPKLRVVVRWKKQDDNSMDKNGTFKKYVKRSEAKGKPVVDGDTVSVPDTVLTAVEFREKQGLGQPDKNIPVYGPNVLQPGKGVIPVYANDFMYAAKPNATGGTSLALAGDEDPFADPVLDQLKAVGAASDRAGGFALGGYSGKGPRPGETAAVTNWNNGGTFGNVRIITNESHMVPRGSVNSLWTGKSDYLGYKYMGEILDSDGKGTGQFIEQTYNPDAGVYNQRMLSRSELSSEVQATLQAREDTIRADNARIAASRATADNYGDRADAMAEEAFKRAKELPGKVVSSAASAAVTEKFQIGKTGTPEQQALAWAATGAAKETSGQAINVGLDKVSGGTVGQSGFNGQKIISSTVGSVVGKSASDDLNKEVVGDLAKAAVEKTVGNAAKVGSEYATSGGKKIPTGDQAAHAVADTAIDVTFSTLGLAVGGPVGKGVAAGGAEIAKVGTAEVGALGLWAAEINSRGQVNADQTRAIQNLSTIRQSGDIADYLNGAPQTQSQSQQQQPQQEPQPQPEPQAPQSPEGEAPGAF